MPVAFGERAFVEDEAAVEWVERRLEVVLLRERTVDTRRVPAVAAARRERECVVGRLVPRGEVRRRADTFPLVREGAERRRPLLVVLFPTRVADAPARRELDVRLLVAMV